MCFQTTFYIRLCDKPEVKDIEKLHKMSEYKNSFTTTTEVNVLENRGF